MNFRRWLWLMWLLAGASPAAAEVVARGVETFPTGGFRLVPAAGTPDAGLCTTLRAGLTAAGDGGSTLYMCDGAGTWNSIASGGGPGVPGISASGTVQSDWSLDTDCDGTDTAARTFTLPAGDGAVCVDATIEHDASAGTLTLDVPSGESIVVADDLVCSADVDVQGTALGVNTTATALSASSSTLTLGASTGAAVVSYSAQAGTGGNLNVWVNGATDLSPTLVVGRAGSFLDGGADVDATLTLRGHQAGDAVGVATSGKVWVDASADQLVLTPPSGGSTSIAAGDVALAAGAKVDGLDPSAVGTTGGAALVGMAQIGTPTYSTVQDMQTLYHSAGLTSGGVINDAGGGNITVDAGTGLIRATNSATATLVFMDWSALGATAIPSDTVRYVGVEYNAGTPQVVVHATRDWNFNTDFPLGTVINEGGTLHILDAPHAVGDHASQMIRRSWETMPLARDERTGGLIIGETGTRNVTLTAGVLWDGLNRFPISAIDTSGAGTFETYYRDGLGGWTNAAGVTQWPNTQYDDGSGTLQNLTAARYAVEHWYLMADGALVMLYPQAQYTTLAAAEAASAPSSLPDRILQEGRMIGRFVFQESDATATDIQSSFETTFAATGATDHGNLAGLHDLGDHDAADIGFDPTGLAVISDPGTVDVQTALEELDAAAAAAGVPFSGFSLYQTPGVAGIGTLSNTTVSLSQWDATERLPYVLVTGSADSATAQIGWSFVVPPTYTAWDTTFLEVGLDFSDATGNNDATLTCKDTAGSTVLTAYDLTQSATMGWEGILTTSLGAGTYTENGIVSCLLTVTTDTADTVLVYGLKWHWTF